MEYIVKLNYSEFRFEDAAKAIAFAETAKEHYRSPDSYDKTIDVSVVVKKKEEEDE